MCHHFSSSTKQFHAAVRRQSSCNRGDDYLTKLHLHGWFTSCQTLYNSSLWSPVSTETQSLAFSRNKRKRQSIGILGRSSGNHDWLLANASACISCGFRLRNTSDCVWMETGLHSVTRVVKLECEQYIHTHRLIRCNYQHNTATGMPATRTSARLLLCWWIKHSWMGKRHSSIY